MTETVQISIEQISGIGVSISATIGARTVVALAATLQIPNTAPKSNVYKCGRSSYSDTVLLQ